MNLDQIVGLNIRKRRLIRGWHQSDLAKAMRPLGFAWTQQTVSLVELHPEKLKQYPDKAPRRNATLPELVALARVLDTSLVALMLPPDNGTVEIGLSELTSTEFLWAAFQLPPTLARPGFFDDLVANQLERMAGRIARLQLLSTSGEWVAPDPHIQAALTDDKELGQLWRGLSPTQRAALWRIAEELAPPTQSATASELQQVLPEGHQLRPKEG